MKEPRPTGRGTNINATDVSTSSTFQAQLDLHQTITAVSGVFEWWLQGRHDDVEAVRIAANCIAKRAHRVRVCRINQPTERH